MKSIQILALALVAATAVSCQPDPVYVPVYVPTETKPSTPARAPRTVTKPKPVESAEGFRAVEKPTTYSN